MASKTMIVASVAAAVAAGFAGGRLAGNDGPTTPDADVAALTARLAVLERERGSTEATPAPVLQGRPESPPEPPVSSAPVPPTGDLAARVATLEAELATAKATNAQLLAWASGGPPPPRDAESERRQLAGLTDAQLMEALRKTVGGPMRSNDDIRRQSERIIEICDLLLARNLASDMRADVLIWKGGAHLRTGAVDAAEPLFEEAVRLAGTTSKHGRNATWQLAVVASQRKDHRRAWDIFTGLADQPDTSTEERVHIRVIGSTYLALADPAAARAIQQAIVDEYGSSTDPNLKSWVQMARQELAKTEGTTPGR